MYKKNIAIILSRFPFPLNKGDKLRAYHQIKYLSNYFDIHLHCLHTEKIEEKDRLEIEKYCISIHTYPLKKMTILKGILLSILNNFPIQVGYFFSQKIKKQIEKNIQLQSVETLYCQLSRTALYAKDFTCKKVIDFQDAFSANYEKIAKESNGIFKIFYRRESKTMKVFEQKIFTWFDESTIISENDKAQIANNQNIHVIQNGVDTNYFINANIEKKYDILFVGNLSYLPNKMAVFYLVNHIFPLLKLKLPNIKINIVGADTTPDIFALANENITVSGFVDDVRSAYNSSTLFVAPLFTGAGLQNKILEAMAMQLPCVSTSVVNASLNAMDKNQIFIANNEDEFVSSILLLLQDISLQNEIKNNAKEFILKKFSWQVANEKLLQIL